MTDFLTILSFLVLAIILITWIWGMFSGKKLIDSTNRPHDGDDLPRLQNRKLMESIWPNWDTILKSTMMVI